MGCSSATDSQNTRHVSDRNTKSAHGDEREYAACSHGPSLLDQLTGPSHAVATAEEIPGESKDHA